MNKALSTEHREWDTQHRKPFEDRWECFKKSSVDKSTGSEKARGGGMVTEYEAQNTGNQAQATEHGAQNEENDT